MWNNQEGRARDEEENFKIEALLRGTSYAFEFVLFCGVFFSKFLFFVCAFLIFLPSFR